MRGEEGDEKQIRREKKKNKNHGSRITDYALPITRYVTHETQNRLHQTFLQAKTFTKKHFSL